MNVLVYVMDALRSDFLSCYGHGHETTPNVDAFAEDAVRFTNAYSTATWTKAAAASLLTSRHPRSLNMLHQMDVMPQVPYFLPRLLSEAGFDTHAVSANNFVAEEFGFGGFDEFSLLQQDSEIQEKRRRAKEQVRENEREIMDRLGIDEIVTPLSEDVNERVFEILDGANESGRDSETGIDDQFVLAWSIDTHGPYFVRGEESAFGNDPDEMIFEDDVSPANVNRVVSLYRDMIRYNDRQFGRLLEHLRSEGLYEDTLIVLAADHGESFADHSWYLDRPIVGHNGLVYEEVVRVPLLVKYPGNEHAGRTVDDLVQLIDVYPTITDVCGVETPAATQGVSLSPPVTDRIADRTLFFESHPLEKRIYSGAVRRGDHKLLKTRQDWYWSKRWRRMAERLLCKFDVPSRQLFDLAADPDERDDLSAERPELVDELEAEFERRRERLDAAAENVTDQRLDELSDDAEKHLRAMGYLE